jgi:hypothetical protein
MAANKTLKVSVLASGSLLLDGRQIALAELERAMDEGAKEGAVIWYYRENGEGEPPPVAMQVLQIVTRNKMPIRMSSKPDFSDSAVPAAPDLEQVFGPIRKRASQRHLVILRPDGKIMQLAAMDRSAAPAEALATIEKLLPSKVSRNVAVIADTSWASAASPTIQAANQAIPFFGMLMGFASVGHAVWIFNSQSADMVAGGCRDADLAIVDSPRMEGLPEGWQAEAVKGMRRPQVLVFDRVTGILRRA